MKQSKQNGRKKLFFLRVGSFFCSCAPLLFVLYKNWDEYVQTPDDAVKLCAGGMLCLFFLLLKVLGKAKLPQRMVLFAIVFVTAYLLQPLLSDLVLLSGMALLGEFVDFLCFQKAIQKANEARLISKTATVTASQVEEVIKQYIGRV